MFLSNAGGSQEVLKNLTPINLTFFKKGILPSMISIFILEGIFSSCIVDSSIATRMLMANSTKKLKKVFLFSAIGYLFFAVSRFFIGSSINQISPESSSNIIDFIYSNMISEDLKILVVIGIMALTLSSADSFLHAAGITFSRDILGMDKKTTNINPIRIITFFTGILGILFARKEIAYLNIDLLLAITSPTLDFPFIVGILGLRPSKKAFWIAASCGLPAFFLSEYGFLGDFLKEYAALFGPLTNAIVYLSVNYFDNGGLYFGQSSEKKSCCRKSCLSSLINFFKNTFYFYSLESYKNRPYETFGIFYILSIAFPYALGQNKEDFVHSNYLLYAKITALALCSLLISKSLWKENLKKYLLNSFWYFSIAYCLAFLPVTNFLYTGGTIETASSIVIYFACMLLLTEWQKALALFSVSTLVASLSLLYYTDFRFSQFYVSVGTKYFFIYNFIFNSMIIIFFAKKHFNSLSNISFRSFFQNAFNQETIEATQRSLTIIEEKKFFYKNSVLDPEKEMHEILESLKSKDYEKVEKGLLFLKEFIKETKNLTHYCSLKVDEIDIEEFLIIVQNMMNSLGIKNITIQNISNYQKMSCDKTAILKTIWKICLDYLLFKRINYEDDYYLSLLIENIKISYTKNDKFFRTVDGISFILTEDGFIEGNSIQENYEIELPNPEKIPAVGIYDEEMSDIQNIIEAHYGDIINLSSKKDFAYQIIIPVIIRDIRHVNLDLV